MSVPKAVRVSVIAMTIGLLVLSEAIGMLWSFELSAAIIMAVAFLALWASPSRFGTDLDFRNKLRVSFKKIGGLYAIFDDSRIGRCGCVNYFGL